MIEIQTGLIFIRKSIRCIATYIFMTERFSQKAENPKTFFLDTWYTNWPFLFCQTKNQESDQCMIMFKLAFCVAIASSPLLDQ